MSMINCERCERCIDAKDEGLEGIYGADSPFEYICPTCVYELADEFRIDDIDYQDQRIIDAWRSPNWEVDTTWGLPDDGDHAYHSWKEDQL